MLRIDEIKTITVIGAGVMGSGIAQTFAQAGYAVRLHARREASLAAARERIAKNQESMVRAELLSEGAARDTLARIQSTTSQEEALDGCHFVSESVPTMPASAIVATRTIDVQPIRERLWALMDRTGIRRPRPSPGGPVPRERPRSSRGADACAR